LTIKQIREAALQAKQEQQAQREPASASLSPAPKKKPSIFAGMFQVKEPTQVALSQVSAQIKAQHGSTSANKVPNVRLEKMPDYVPKVNSKWDGVPEAVKQRDKREKEMAKAGKRNSIVGRGSNDADRGRRNVGSSGSSLGSFGSRARSSGSHTDSERTRVYTRSVNSSGDLASQQRTNVFHRRPSSTRKHSVPSISETDVPEGGGKVPDIPSSLREEPTIVAESSASWRRKENNTLIVAQPEGAKRKGDNDPSQQSDIAAVPVTEQTSACAVDTVFLAGEAQEVVVLDFDARVASDLPLHRWDAEQNHPGGKALMTGARPQQSIEQQPNGHQYVAASPPLPSSPKSKSKFGRGLGLWGKEKDKDKSKS
jgi:hypothetical protein